MPCLLYEVDLAIIAGGFLKYEMAAIGTPGIITSIVPHQQLLSKKFKKLQLARYAGYLPEMNPDCLTKAILEMMKDYSLRKKMSKTTKENEFTKQLGI